MSIKRIISSLSVVLVLSTALASPARAATWSVVPTPNASTGLNILIGVDALSTTDAWAVGRAEGSATRPLVARWNGSTWSTVPTPATGGQLSGVDGSAANNVWAVGTGDTGALTERWNGTAWSIVPNPAAAGAQLAGVKTFSTTNAWAVGTQTATTAPHTRTLVQRWNGSAWTAVPSPNPDPTRNLLSDVDGASANDVWAIGNVGDDGYGGTVAGMVLHWDGTAWTQVTVPDVPTLTDVVALAANDVWLVGRAFSWADLKVVPVALHWNGQTWQRTVMSTAPNDGAGFLAVTALSPTKVYAAGTVVARWTGTAWVADSTVSGGELSDLAATGTSTVLGVGWQYDPGLSQLRTLGMRTTNG